MAKIPTLQEASRYVLFHHEAFNGKGYPYGLDGDKIPTQSQIIGIADLLYTNYLLLHNDIGSAVSAVKMLRGTRFNPIVVDALTSIYEHDKFWFITGISDLELDIIQNFDLAILIEYSHIRESGYFDELLDVYLSIIDIKHKYTRQHSHRVAQISKLIAQQAGLATAEVNDIYYAGLLHDIGKVAIPQYILNKPSELSVDEYEMIKSHPEYTYAILSKVNIFENIAKLARYHHEKHSGGGYPHNLKGDEIPVGSRIISIADAYDAITSNRPYTGQFNSDFAIQQLVRNPYKMFDPDLLAAVVKIPLENLEQFTVNKR
jgi:putative nucleotidyltransferase with HDIG domain